MHDEPAPDGSTVTPLLRGERGSLARFTLAAGGVTRAVRHRSVEELWYVLSGSGELWTRAGRVETTLTLAPGVCAQITPDTDFQFRSDDDAALVILGATLPAWPGDAEATIVAGCWVPTH